MRTTMGSSVKTGLLLLGDEEGTRESQPHGIAMVTGDVSQQHRDYGRLQVFILAIDTSTL